MAASSQDERQTERGSEETKERRKDSKVIRGCNGAVDAAMAEAIGEVLAEGSTWMRDGTLLGQRSRRQGPLRENRRSPRKGSRPSAHPCERIAMFIVVFLLLLLLLLSGFLQMWWFPGLYEFNAGSQTEDDCMDDSCEA
mmetsp:Transcript_20514/g.42893  ORF Transcript_20514/g.42893 Transcript_20514/m.42893 type:complete len:139 (+) Transcript_20514:68-484(+)